MSVSKVEKFKNEVLSLIVLSMSIIVATAIAGFCEYLFNDSKQLNVVLSKIELYKGYFRLMSLLLITATWAAFTLQLSKFIKFVAVFFLVVIVALSA